ALSGHSARARVGQGGKPDDADGSESAAAPSWARLAVRPAPASDRRAHRRGADPSTPLGARAADGPGGRHLQPQRPPQDGRGHREEPRRAACLDRRAVRRHRRARRHRRLGHLVVPVPRRPGLRAARSPRRARPRADRSRPVFQAVERARRGRRAARPRDPARLMSRYAVRRLEDVPRIASDAEDPDWYPVQHYFRFTAFGVNVYVAKADGDELLAAHDELSSKQEELYFVTVGEATFDLDGEQVD